MRLYGQAGYFLGNSFSVFSPEPEVHKQCKHTWNQKNDESHKVNAFDLLFVDGSQNMVESVFLPNDVPHIVRFT